MSLEAVIAEDRRLVILRTLGEADNYVLNESTLGKALSYIGHQVARDVVRADLSFLKAHDLVRLETLYPPSGELWLAHLTDAGLSVANGRHHPGVARPSPE